MNHLYSPEELAQVLRGQWAAEPAKAAVGNFSIDSRKVAPGDVFFCVRGENNDGHDFAEQAANNGASVIVASHHRGMILKPTPQCTVLQVADPNRALRDLAAHYRGLFTHGKVLSVTGSNGKTSSKEIASSLLSLLGQKTHATQGNFNNFIGLPLTILGADLSEDWWVTEIGTNHFGEISTLSRIARPDCGILTNIGESHLEYLLSTLGVACEKAGLFQGMSPGTMVAIPHDLQHRTVIEEFARVYDVELISYGISRAEKAHKSTSTLAQSIANIVSSKGSESNFSSIGQLQTSVSNLPQTDYLAQVINIDEHATFILGGKEFTCPITNTLLLKNAIGVMSLLHRQGFSLDDLRDALAKLELQVKGRLHKIQLGKLLLVDDTYNANPTSFASVAHSLRLEYPKLRLLVVAGAMAELGPQSSRFHIEVGERLNEIGVDVLLSCGDNNAKYYVDGWQNISNDPNKMNYFAEYQDALQWLTHNLQENDVVLVKGSRSSKMEIISEGIRQFWSKRE